MTVCATRCGQRRSASERNAPHDNTALIGRILALRAEKAALLGKPHFAELLLERRMAKNGARALEFLNDLQQRTTARLRASAVSWKSSRRREQVSRDRHWRRGSSRFWSEKLRRSRYDFDEEILRPYFPMNRVIAGLFDLAQRVFGLRVIERRGGRSRNVASGSEVLRHDGSERATRRIRFMPTGIRANRSAVVRG